MKDKVLTLLGFAAKAVKLSYGMDASIASAAAGRARLIVIASDISAKSRKEIIFHSEKYTVKTLELDGFNIETVSKAVGRKCGIVSVNDQGFADALLRAYL